MSFIDWIQILFFIIIVILISPLIGRYMASVFQGKLPSLPPLGKIEEFIYRLCKIVPTEEMNWKQYLNALLLFNVFGFVLLFLIQVTQYYLPLNPQNLPNVPWDLAFNTAASFVTNTNWQAYSGETTLSYFTQMAGLTTQNFVSTATGMGLMLALIRGFMGRLSENIGNFWSDLVKTIVYILLPLSIVLSLLLVSQGVVQTLKPYQEVTTLENEKQIIPRGPAASQVAIKQLGTNGGGFFGANSAHPMENPTTVSNFLEHLAILLIPAGLAFTFGFMINDRQQGKLIFYLMVSFWVVAVAIAGVSQIQFNPALNIATNMEGLETRLHTSNSVFWTMSTTDASNGSTNAAITSLEPLTGGVAMFNIMLGEQIFGGIGTGICTMVKFILLSVFIGGLMVGRTPEYLGKKIGKEQMLWAIIVILGPPVLTLLGTAASTIVPQGIESESQRGPHGFTEILYAFTSASGNNGSSFNGLNANTPYYNIFLGIIMVLGRLTIIVPTLAIAGSVVSKRYYPPSQGTVATNTLLFGILLASVIIIVGALSFFPSLILGPIFEHFLMLRGEVF